MVSNEVEPHLFIILGALGDLTRRKLLPAVYHLSDSQMFGENHIFLGVDTDEKMDDQGYRAWASEALTAAGLTVDMEAATYWCDCRLHYQHMDVEDKAGYQKLKTRIAALEEEHKLPGNRIFYMALPGSAISSAICGLGENQLNRSPGWTRLVMEKPFGWNLASAQELNRVIHQYFSETQIYRIDHFLGKETVQNLLVLRFANAFIEHLWNREHIKSIQITVAESLGIEARAQYYEMTGALRDMIQNHLTQLLCLIAMEIPSAFKPEDIRYEKIKVLRQIVPILPEAVVLGQYSTGKIENKNVVGYREEPGVMPMSGTETFAALKLEVASWRWKGVPFYLRTGKRLPLRYSQIVVHFERAPVSVFQPFASSSEIKPNFLVINIQPDEGIDLGIQIKSPGDPLTITTQQLKFRYVDAFGAVPAAYEHLIMDVGTGDQALFVCDEEVEISWQLYDSLLGEDKTPVYPYPAGTWGPDEINNLGVTWHNLELE